MIVSEAITTILTDALAPMTLVLDNQSDRHIGHAGHDGSGESHFHVTIVSSYFEGLSRLERHRVVNDLLADFIPDKIHALSITAATPQEKIDQT